MEVIYSTNTVINNGITKGHVNTIFNEQERYLIYEGITYEPSGSQTYLGRFKTIRDADQEIIRVYANDRKAS